MTQADSPDIDNEALIRRLRDAVRGRRAALSNHVRGGPSGEARTAATPPNGVSTAPSVEGDRASVSIPDSAGEIAVKQEYLISDFTCFHDADFVRNAYRGILHRESDPTGYTEFLDALRTARRSKPEILGSLRYSPEGRVIAVRVRGLAFAFALRRARRIPPLGWLLDLPRCLACARDYERLEARVFHHRTELARELNALAESVVASTDEVASVLAAVDDRQSRLARRVRDIKVEMAIRVNALGIELNERLVRDRQAAIEAFASLESASASLQREQRTLARDLDDLRSGLSERMREEFGRMLAAQHALPDELYLAFEDRFRGSRDLIKARISIYLERIHEACAVTDAPVLDIGCGRGEWLEFLRENSVAARGVDSNEAMLAECVGRGLDVVRGDALEHLRTLPADSLGGVTAFHIVEHLPFPMLVALIAQIHRVLRPGGIIVLETPNPENLIVGACNFYFDPTHRAPIPPPLLEFFVQHAGFSETTILRLHPSEVPGEFTIHDQLMRNWLFGAQDYAVTGRKAAIDEPAGDSSQASEL